MKLDTAFLVYAGDATYRLEVGEDRVEANGNEVVIVNDSRPAVEVIKTRTAKKAARIAHEIEKKFRTWSEHIARFGGEETFDGFCQRAYAGIVRQYTIA